MLGQLALELASNKKMKQLLDVQPLQVCVQLLSFPLLQSMLGSREDDFFNHLKNFSCKRISRLLDTAAN